MKTLHMYNQKNRRNHSVGRIHKICGRDLGVMIRAFQALCPGSNPGVRIITFYNAGVAKPGQRRRT